MFILMLCVAAAVLGQPDLPTVTVTRDNTVIDRSCRVVIPAGTVIRDDDGDGVIHIGADGITVEFAPGQAGLVGATPGTPWDAMTGVGIRVEGRRGVTIKGAGVHSFKVGIWATSADGLVLDGCDVSGGYAMRLKSTPEAEDGSDWLWPHQNDRREWTTNYGAGICVERSDGVTIRSCVARRRQNGIVLDRVTRSRVYDNDCSFLSGWGLAMWRCTENVVSRNAFDFCVRGYSHGVYNRGQDSAGILFFEQNSDNVIAENSATHGGDGFFGFGGREALGEDRPADVQPSDYTGRGNSGNLLIRNDFSYAPAHGIEMTFSFRNRFIENRLVGNAICGVWGGYSQDTLIARNTIEDNGEMAYGLERGGINIEHGAGNQILNNTFKRNRCGVHLWWDRDEGLMSTPWAKANNRGTGPRAMPSIDNTIAENTFDGDAVGLHLRDCDGTTTVRNTYTGVVRPIDATPGSEPREMNVAVSWEMPAYRVYGESRPVGARVELAGRDSIVMTEWFPWDHQSPLARVVRKGADAHVIEFNGIDGEHVRVWIDGVSARPLSGRRGEVWRHSIGSGSPGVTSYRVVVDQDGYHQELSGTVVKTEWQAAFFNWPRPEPARDPDGTPRVPPDLEAWRALARAPDAVKIVTPRLSFAFGGGGPRDAVDVPVVKASALGRDYFGMVAQTTLPLPKGRWRIRTLSDDGIRVIVDGQTLIENWTHHGAARDQAEFELPAPAPASITVEYFEIYGAAVVEFEIEPVP
jgi:parallel beta-helix repeat protein